MPMQLVRLRLPRRLGTRPSSREAWIRSLSVAPPARGAASLASPHEGRSASSLRCHSVTCSPTFRISSRRDQYTGTPEHHDEKKLQTGSGETPWDGLDTETLGRPDNHRGTIINWLEYKVRFLFVKRSCNCKALYLSIEVQTNEG